MTKQKSVFNEFTGKYQLSKTLRFELKPVGNTQKMLETERVFETDRIRHKKYEETKPWIDRLHSEFIKEALSNFRFNDLKPYRKAFEAWQKDKKSKSLKSALAKEEDKLREEIVKQFDKTAKRWAEKYTDLKLKKADIGVLFEAGVFRILKKRYKNEEGTTVKVEDGKNINIFDDWDKWTGYFKKFFQTRKNFYSSGKEPTAITYRIVNQNLRRFIQDMQLFAKAKEKIDIAKIENNLGILCSEVFSLDYYNNCLLQEGIDKYNRIIGGYVGENDKKIPGINEAINKYRQDNKCNKLKFLAMLDKQIHSEKEKFIDAIESDKELIERLGSFAKAADAKLEVFKKLIDDFTSNGGGSKYDLNKIYISSKALERNASRWFRNYTAFERALAETSKEYKNAYGILDQKPVEEKDGQVKYPDFLILAHIKSALDRINGQIFKERYYEKIPHFKNLSRFEQFLQVIKYEVEQQFSREDNNNKTIGYKVYRNKIAPIINSADYKINREAKISIKNFAQSALTIYQMAKYFAVEKKRRWLDYFELDNNFYNAADAGYMFFYGDTDQFKSAYEEIVKGYNALRNYLTKKPWEDNKKWKLNFENPTLADGFDKNKESSNFTVILRKGGKYYLGIMKKGYNHLFDDKNKERFVGSGYEKMVYKQVADSSKDIHNLVLMKDGSAKRFTKMKNKEKNWPPEITRIKREKSYAKENFNRNDFETFVDYMKKCVVRYWPDFKFKFSPTKSYKNIKEFTDEINYAGYKISFEDISEKYIEEKNQNGELYLFEIHDKDWNLKNGKEKTGAKNLHTLYWEQLFSEENKKQNFVFKLNGEAELFFRPKTDEKDLGYKIKYKGKWVKVKVKKEDERYFYIKNQDENKKEIKVDKKEVKSVVDRKRYADNTILFHCPITLNRISENKTDFQVNADIRKAIVNNKKVRIVGIDRGEKNLVYYSLIDQNSKIIEDGSLNTIGKTNGKPCLMQKFLKNGQRTGKRSAASGRK